METIRPFLEVRAGLLRGVKLNEETRRNLWKIFDYVRELVTSELDAYSRERGEESREWKLHYEKREEIDLPDDIEGRFEKVNAQRSSAAVAILILAISPESIPFSHSNCLTRSSIAFAQLSTEDLIEVPKDLSRVAGPILHELLHSLLVPHTRTGVMYDGRIPEGREEGGEYPTIRCMGNIEAAILSHHPVIVTAERSSAASPITVTKPDTSTVVLSTNVVYCIIVRNTVAERVIDWRGRDQTERRVPRLEEGDQLVVCCEGNVRCFALTSIPLVQ